MPSNIHETQVRYPNKKYDFRRTEWQKSQAAWMRITRSESVSGRIPKWPVRKEKLIRQVNRLEEHSRTTQRTNQIVAHPRGV